MICEECGKKMRLKAEFFSFVNKKRYICDVCKIVKVYDKFGLKEEWKDGKLITERKIPL